MGQLPFDDGVDGVTQAKLETLTFLENENKEYFS